jgi:uncharacterized protein YcgI (DUF1989 family)
MRKYHTVIGDPEQRPREATEVRAEYDFIIIGANCQHGVIDKLS